MSEGAARFARTSSRIVAVLSVPQRKGVTLGKGASLRPTEFQPRQIAKEKAVDADATLYGHNRVFLISGVRSQLSFSHFWCAVTTPVRSYSR